MDCGKVCNGRRRGEEGAWESQAGNAKCLLICSYFLLQAPPLAEDRVRVLHLHPALLDTIDTGQSRTAIGCSVLMTSFSLCLMRTMAMMVKVDGVLPPFQSRTTAVRSPSTRSISVWLWRISSTFASTLRSRRFVSSLFSCDSEGQNLKSQAQVS